MYIHTYVHMFNTANTQMHMQTYAVYIHTYLYVRMYVLCTYVQYNKHTNAHADICSIHTYIPVCTYVCTLYICSIQQAHTCMHAYNMHTHTFTYVRMYTHQHARAHTSISLTRYWPICQYSLILVSAVLLLLIQPTVKTCNYSNLLSNGLGVYYIMRMSKTK